MVHNITQTKVKLIAYVQSSCTKIIRHCNKYIKIKKQSSFLAGLQLRHFKKLGLRLRARIQTSGTPTLHPCFARLVLGWIAVFGQAYHLYTSIHSQPPRQIQSTILRGWEMSISQSAVTSAAGE